MVGQVLSSVSGFSSFLETLSLENLSSENLSAFLQQNRLRLITRPLLCEGFVASAPD